MEAGRLRHRADVYERPEIPDGRGGYKQGDWTKLTTIWVGINGLSVKDRFGSGVHIPDDVVKITCRWTPHVRPQRRLVALGETYEVDSADADSKRTMLNVIARRVPTNGGTKG